MQCRYICIDFGPVDAFILVNALIVAFWMALSYLATRWAWRKYTANYRQDTDLVEVLQEGERLALISLRQLKKATDSFSESKQLGEGGFGKVYFGELSDGKKVAIKKGKHEGSNHYKQQFLNEVRILSQVHHRHLVKLVGCSLERKIALLVFEFISNGTLQEHLQGKIGAKRLDWKQRVKIALQVADALNYLHSATSTPIFHRDVKSANILLDENLNAKVADFGISKLAPVEATQHPTFAVQGTFGYIDPAYISTGYFCDKSDVYSFGVVLLELISAKSAVDISTNSSLVKLAQPHVDSGDLELLIDPALMETYHDPIDDGRVSILNVGRLAMECLDQRQEARPNMEEVRRELQTLFPEFLGASSRPASGTLPRAIRMPIIMTMSLEEMVPQYSIFLIPLTAIAAIPSTPILVDLHNDA